jgi:D-alanyl-D-alanine carboxypeptidase
VHFASTGLIVLLVQGGSPSPERTTCEGLKRNDTDEVMPQTEFHAYWIAADGTEGECGDVTARFPYWSFTKTVIAICALKLCEDGVIDLDARLDDENYTLRQLLNHTAGLPDYGALPEYRRGVAADETPWPREKLLGAVLAKGPLFAAGEG